MILILCEELDESVNLVIDYLTDFKLPIIRINTQNPVEDIIINNFNNISLVIGNNTLNIDDIKVVWYHRGDLNFNFKNIVSSKYIDHLKSEWVELKNFILTKIFQKAHLGSYFNRKLNKLIVLELARKFGLTIPDSYVLSQFNSIPKDFLKENFITKSIGYLYNDKNDKTFEVGYTSKIRRQDIDNKKMFFPAFIQNEIAKKFEVRTFYIEGEFYSCAIFSQNSSETSVDYRNFGIEPSFKCIPYRLPPDIEQKINNLMHNLNLDIGSIDLIVCKNGLHFFLEINPFGQFGMFLEYLNENIPFIIANKLKYKYQN